MKPLKTSDKLPLWWFNNLCKFNDLAFYIIVNNFEINYGGTGFFDCEARIYNTDLSIMGKKTASLRSQKMIRCPWCGDDPLYVKYHDEEWGVPLHDDNKLFEFLILEGFQAGLSWRTVLYKRENFRKAFDEFSAEKIARYNKRKIDSLLNNAGIIRNKLKVAATIGNAKAYLKILDKHVSFDKYIWQFTEGQSHKEQMECP